MNKITPKALTGFKYIYLLMFFALLSGFFHPLISGSSFGNVAAGVVVLFVGLAGGIMVYKGASQEKRRIIFLGGGFGLIVISLFYIFQLTGRV